MPTILLIRHGQASFGTSDYDVLSELGERQARLVGEALASRGLRPRVVVTGSLRRQIDTAAIAAADDWPAARPDPRWNEYDADDVLTAHSTSAARLQHADGTAVPALTTREFQAVLDEALFKWIEGGGESEARQQWPSFETAGHGALAELASELGRGELGLVFTSAGTIAATCAKVLALPPDAFVALNRVQINTGITKLVFGERGASMVSFNDHSHLEAGDRSLITFR